VVGTDSVEGLLDLDFERGSVERPSAIVVITNPSGTRSPATRSRARVEALGPATMESVASSRRRTVGVSLIKEPCQIEVSCVVTQGGDTRGDHEANPDGHDGNGECRTGAHHESDDAECSEDGG